MRLGLFVLQLIPNLERKAEPLELAAETFGQALQEQIKKGFWEPVIFQE